MIIWIIVAAIVLLFGFVVFRGAPYVPTHRKQIDRALTELYAVTKDDTLVDIGSGDGIVLRCASQRGARAVGYELNPLLVLVSKVLSRGDPNVTVHLADFWLTPLPDDTTVVYIFTVSRDLAKLHRTLQAEANRLNRPILLMMYGHKFADMTPKREVGAHALYEFRPLH